MARITSRSPLAPEAFPELPVIPGVRFATVEAGVRYKDRTDVMLADLVPGTTVAGVFTRSATRSAPVLDCQEKLGGSSGSGAAIIVNSGNANAFTGRNGETATSAVTSAVARVMDLPDHRVFSSATGVIGEALAHDRITDKLEDLKAGLDEGRIEDAANAIMTTDTYPKGASVEVVTPNGTVRIAGIAKGSGMIAPDMATMLVYIFTDARIAQDDLQALVSKTSDMTFNCITVDSDTSTSDTLLMCATGASGIDIDRTHSGFALALQKLMLDLAHQVVKDGEGATKFVTISVTGAATDADARVHALSVANSPLVKTAVAGEDPNWGRVVMAVGKSGAAADRDALSIRFADVLVAEKGWVAAGYREEEGAALMKETDIEIGIDIGLGQGQATVWTCDLTHGYITINADYRS